MRDLLYVDTETVGLVGPVVLIQYGYFREQVHLYHVFEHTSRETMALIERIMDEGYVVFNAAFDQFKLQQLYCLLDAAGQPGKRPTAKRLHNVERRAVFGPCVKPRHILDLDVALRSGPYQMFMGRDPVVVYNVPDMVLDDTRHLLDGHVAEGLDPLYFSGIKTVEDRGRFKVVDEVDNPGFHHLKLSFRPQLTLKRIHQHIFGQARDGLPVPPEIMPLDKQPKPGKSSKVSWTWMPYAEAVEFQGVKRERMWPEVLNKHVKFWLETDSSYAEDDITMLYDLDEHLEFPEANDTNSVLAAAVGSVRYRGFPINLAAATERHLEAEEKVRQSERVLGCSLDQHSRIRERLMDACVEELEQTAITSSSDEVLLQLTKWETEDGAEHPVAKIASLVREGRTAKKRVNLLSKLLLVGRFHPGFRVLGTVTDRMAGSDGINPQGIDKQEEIRGLFTMVDEPHIVRDYFERYEPRSLRSRYVKSVLKDLTDDPFTLSGGDFEGFETAIAVAVWADETLGAYVRAGEKPYMLLGRRLYETSINTRLRARYLEALKKRKVNAIKAMKIAQKYTPEVLRWLKRSEFGDEKGRAKNAWYGWVYGAQTKKLSETTGLSETEVDQAFAKLYEELPGVKESRTAVQEALRCIAIGEGGKWHWRDPIPFIDSLLGYTRTFEREIPLIRRLWAATDHIPREWNQPGVEIVRSEKRGPQQVGSAVRSAIFGAAMSMQGRIQRQGSNFQMQCPGAMICKRCQASIWGLQPPGVSKWLVQPINVHDEVICQHRAKVGQSCSDALYSEVEAHRRLVPLIAIDWKQDIPSWYDK